MERRRRSKAEWAELIREFQAAGESPEEAAERLGLKLSTLQWWVWKLGTRTPRRKPASRAVAADVVELVVAHETAGRSDLGPRLLRVRLQGIEIEVEEGTDVDYVGALLEVAARC